MSRALISATQLIRFSRHTASLRSPTSANFLPVPAQKLTLGHSNRLHMSGQPLPARPSSDLLSRLSAPLLVLSGISTSGTSSSIPSSSTLPSRPAYALPSKPTFVPLPALSSTPPRPRRDSLSPAPRRREEDDHYIPEADTYRPRNTSRRDSRPDVYIASESTNDRIRRRSSSPPPKRRRRSRSGSDHQERRSISPLRASRARSRSPLPSTFRKARARPDSRSRSPSLSRRYASDRSPPPSRSDRRSRPAAERSPPPANFTTRSEYTQSKRRPREPSVERKPRPPVPDQASVFNKAREEVAAKEKEARDKAFAEGEAKRQIEREERQKAFAEQEERGRIAREAREKAIAEERARKQKAFEEKEAIFAEERARKQKLSELRKQRAKEEAKPRSAPVAAKRPISPTATSGPPQKFAKAIPTGPRGVKPIPTGPSSSRRQVAPVPASAPEPRSPSRSPSPTSTDDEMNRGRGRGRTPASSSNGRSSGGNGGNRSQPLPLPEWSEQQIVQMYGSHLMIKEQWRENPKSPLANYLGSGGGATNLGQGGGAYKVQEGFVGSKRMFRVSVVGDPDRNIIGVGDHTSRKDAERLAALSAVLQLQDAGLLEQGRPKQSGHSTPAPQAASQFSSGETATLTDGSTITYDRARQFMEYYCKRYKFGKPDIDFTQSQGKSRKGKAGVMAWEAVMTVGGRKIGMGQATNKKTSQIKCYLDVTQYLESCDQDLWRDFTNFSKHDTSADIGLAPHLLFRMSDELNEDVQGLIGDIRVSSLLKNAPKSGVTSGDQPMPSWGGGRSYHTSEQELARKSIALQDKLADYQSDPRLVKMRAQRTSLPVTSRATDILAKIEVNDVTIVMAATGSGKTTQIPQLLFDDYINRGQGAKCNIICTQPRRLAAMSVAERIADERGDRLGVEIGYQVRFDVKLPQPNGSITFCTTGIFLKRMQSSLGVTADAAAVAAMDMITHIVVDEVHERDIDTDLLLVVLKRLLSDRKARGVPLKVILMSATIDPTLFQRYFADAKGRLAPVAEVPGRTFPVERHYLDETIKELQKGLPASLGGWVFQEKNVAKYLQEELSPNKAGFNANTGIALEIPYPLVALMIAYVMQRSEDGHVLVFLPGWDEIKKVADILLDKRSNLLGVQFSDSKKYSIHYLHSSIPAAEQKEVFRDPPAGVRRIILATNIAETSITIPNVVYVVDTGRVKEKRYDPERHMSSLVSAWVGKSNLNQRAGRAGRHREGEYFGLISKNRMESLDPHQLVEMKRSDLSNVVMHVKALNLGEVSEVLEATIEPPERNRIVAAMEVLRMLGALDTDQNLTSLGRVLLQLPIDAAMGKMCLYGSFFRCLDSALTLAAVLTNRDPFLSPLDKKAQADEIKDSWSPLAFRSDPLATVAAYNVWTLLDDRGDYHKANQFCSENFLSKPTLLQIKQVKASLLQSLDQAGVIAVSAGGNVGRLGRRGAIPPQLNEHSNSLPMLAALIAMAAAPNFALRTSEKTCRTAQDKSVMIHGSSVNSRRREVNGPEQASASFNPAEKRLYAFQEKGRNVSPGQNPNSAPTQLRTVTRLDPMTYMLFGAYELVVTQRGMECDRWLPVTGNLHALDDVQRLKDLLDACMLRVFEGVGKSLVKGRDQRWVKQEKTVDVRQSGSSRIDDDQEEGNDEGENESDDEDDDAEKKGKRVAEPLSNEEIKELEMLTSDVVRILDAYSREREGNKSTMASRAPTPGGAHYPNSSSGGGGGTGYGHAQGGYGLQGPGGGNGQAVYKPPGAANANRW